MVGRRTRQRRLAIVDVEASPSEHRSDEREAPTPNESVDVKIDWSDLPVADLRGTELEWSTIVQEDRFKNAKKKTCILCGHQYTGGPNIIREHMDANIKPRHVTMLCHA